MKLIRHYFKLIFLILWVTYSGLAYAQPPDFKKLDELIKENKNYSALKILQSTSLHGLKHAEQAKAYFYYAKAYTNENLDDKAFKSYLNAKKEYIAADSIEQAVTINLEIAYLLDLQRLDFSDSEKYIREYIDFAKKKNDSKMLSTGYLSWASLLIDKKPNECLRYLKKALYYSDGNNQSRSVIYDNLAVFYNEIQKKPDSALFYLDKALHINLENKSDYNICLNYINQAGVYYYKKEHQQAIRLLKKAMTIQLNRDAKSIRATIYLFLSMNYNGLKDYQHAYESLSKSHELQDVVSNEKQETKISEFHTQYKTQEKEIENLSLKNKLQTNKIIMYAFLLLLVIFIVFGILVYKNISKKKTIAEQEKLIETQKLEKTLKDQELHDIDLMLESQEKERQHIANDLHDHLGSMLATLKLNFQNLKRQTNDLPEQQQKLYDKTDSLIEDAYQSVRNIAHLKNLGVVGNQGLLTAVKKMAEKMSVIEKFTINVIPFGLNERLDNQIEVSLFRMIQELCTNIIKHSQADEVNIYLTQDEVSNINIMIEDNGQGFDPANITSKDGMGLKAIEKKVEQMGGTFTIDSIRSKGTTVILDIPL